jgi:hypothetical protein
MSKGNPVSAAASQTLDDAFQPSPEARLLVEIVRQNAIIIELLQKIMQQGED